MTQKKKHGFVLACLMVILLFVVSGRIDQPGTEDIEYDPADSELNAPVLPLPDAVVEPTPTPTPEAPKPPLVDLSSWELKLVNDVFILSSSFAPNVSEISNQQYFDTRAVEALNAMLQGASDAGYSTCVRTGYRPYSSQAYLFFGKASQLSWDGTMSYPDAEIEARKYVAYPGTSEHQLGLAVDIMDSSETTMKAETAADLPVLLWLKENCDDYGFILRYPQEKQELTGWYEPWHFRYVGKEAAAFIMENDLCLEEFLELCSER